MVLDAAHLPSELDPASVDLVAAGNLPRAWSARWAADPTHPTLHDEREGWVTAQELETRTRTVAGRFAAAGLAPGDRLVISASASVELAVAHVAALRLGLVVVPTNIAYRRRELAHIVHDAAPAAAVVDDPDRAAMLADAAEGRPLLVAGTDVALPDGPPPLLDASPTDHPAVIGYTSGTTGAPKGAVLSHGNLLASAEALRLAWRWTSEDRLVLPLPLFHMHGLGVGLHGTLGAGASAVLQPTFSVDDVLRAVATHQATLFFGVPTMYHRLAESPRLGELAALRLCVSGSAPLPASLHTRIEAGSGQRVLERYGMTETAMNVSNPYDGERRPGTVGLPLPGVELRLAPGTDEIELRGPNVFSGYWGRPEATAAAFTDDGWFRTGDVGSIAADGYVSIVGRSKELIITGGYNVYPWEVEDVLRSHPSVIDVAVVGVPHPGWGEEVVAVVEGPAPHASADEAALLALATEGLAPYKRPKRAVYVPALPRNALGKVLKDDVRALL